MLKCSHDIVQNVAEGYLHIFVSNVLAFLMVKRTQELNATLFYYDLRNLCLVYIYFLFLLAHITQPSNLHSTAHIFLVSPPSAAFWWSSL